VSGAVDEFHYRDAREDDAPALAAFSAETFVETFGTLYPPDDLAAFLSAKYAPAIQAKEIRDPTTRYRLVFRADELVGYAKSGALTLPTDAHHANPRELHRLYVASRVKGAGAAQNLMQDELDFARAQACDALYLSVWENNLRAQRFYKRYGFVHVGEHGFMVGSVRDRDFIWRLTL
jgi:ribosomal protein S18 acetylase RimI-like enzyme